MIVLCLLQFLVNISLFLTCSLLAITYLKLLSTAACPGSLWEQSSPKIIKAKDEGHLSKSIATVRLCDCGGSRGRVFSLVLFVVVSFCAHQKM